MMEGSATNILRERQNNISIGSALSESMSIMSRHFLPIAASVILAGVPTLFLSLSWSFLHGIVYVLIGAWGDINYYGLTTYFTYVFSAVSGLQEIVVFPLAATYIARLAIRDLRRGFNQDMPAITATFVAKLSGVGLALFLVYLFTRIATSDALFWLHEPNPLTGGSIDFIMYTTHFCARFAELMLWSAFFSFVIPLCAINGAGAAAGVSESARLTSGNRGIIMAAYAIPAGAVFAVAAALQLLLSVLHLSGWWPGIVVSHVLISILEMPIFVLPVVIMHQLILIQQTAGTQQPPPLYMVERSA